MKRIKRICSVILMLTMVLTISQPVMASSSADISETYIDIPISSTAHEEPTEIVIGTVPEGVARAGALLTVSISRIWSSENCQVILHWSGNDVYNAWKFSSIEVKPANLLNKKPYGTIDGDIRNVVASATGSVVLGSVKIPLDVTKAKVDVSGLYGYSLTSGWLSAIIVEKTGEIN